MKPLIAILIIVSFVFGSFITVNAQKPDQIYQKALVKEEGEGALQDAIELYSQVAENPNAGIPLQAKALLHVGLCYEKMGKQEALKAYQRLVDNFPGQKQEVAVARERIYNLTALLVKKNNSEEENSKVLTNRKIWNAPDTDIWGAISPNGKYLSYVDWDTGDLAIYKVESGKKEQITNKGSWDENSEYVENSIWFPDNKRLAYVWYNSDDYTEIRTIEIENKETRTILNDENYSWIQLFDCSSDGKMLLASVAKKDNNSYLVLISTSDGSVEEFKSVGSYWPHEMTFFDEDKYIVYDLPEKENEENRDIYVWQISTGKETKVVKHPQSDVLLGSVPNTNYILFCSDRAGTPDFYQLLIENGQVVGQPAFVQKLTGPFLPKCLGFTTEGKFCYGKITSKIDVFVAELDPFKGKVISKPKRAINNFVGHNATPDYSNDGKYLAFVSKRPPGIIKYTKNHIGNTLCIRTLDTGKEKELKTDLKLIGWPRWTSDDKSVLVVSLGKNYSYCLINTTSGETTPIIETDGRYLFGGHCLSGDGKSIYYGMIDKESRLFQLRFRNLTNNEEKILYESKEKFGISLSPDEKYISVISDLERAIKLFSLEYGEVIELTFPEEFDEYSLGTWGVQFTWSADCKYIYFAVRRRVNDKYQYEIFRVSVEDAEFMKTGLVSDMQFVNLNVHPNGRYFSFSAREESNSEVWMMENFLPLNMK